ncbi:hypothetical protein CASFOL_027657 [Castilleja foliolosa]|uniref:Short-chain dehydrogenase TIC 32, chloroplastic n=1 Tax=Castilleja foliolosa TaxID=1961234 RepID=A0ABD3CFH2_9LAMI
MLRMMTGKAGRSGFGSASTAEQVTQGIDASNLTAIITGGASGIGLETARVLASRNAHVFIAARNIEAANEAKQLILNDHKNARVDVLKLDIASVKSINAFADSFIALNLPLNILINNAGIMFCPYQLSEDGVEIQFATNHLGHFYLTNLLLYTMKETASSTGIEGRIVNLSSMVHNYTYKEGIRFEKINDKERQEGIRAIEISQHITHQRANKTLKGRWSKHYRELGSSRVDNDYKLFQYSGIWMKILKFFTSTLIWKNIHQGAATTCYVALHPSLKGVSGKYFMDCNELKPSRLARNEVLAKGLWEYSTELVNEAKNSLS